MTCILRILVWWLLFLGVFGFQRRERFVQRTSGVGQPFCYADPPSKVVRGVRSSLSCLVEHCASTYGCLSANYRKDTGNCELYDFCPGQEVEVEGCRNFVRGNIAGGDLCRIHRVSSHQELDSTILPGVTSEATPEESTQNPTEDRTQSSPQQTLGRNQSEDPTQGTGMILNPTTSNMNMNPSTSGYVWTVIQQNFRNSSLSFNRTWSEYRDGFGDLTGNYWHGNENIRQLTSTGCWKLRIEIQLAPDGDWYTGEFYDFLIKQEPTKYMLQYANYVLVSSSRDAGNAFEYGCSSGGQGAKKFSTFDSVNGNPGSNNPTATGGGWWYSNCSRSTLNSNGQAKWGNYTVRNSRMMIQMCT